MHVKGKLKHKTCTNDKYLLWHKMCIYCFRDKQIKNKHTKEWVTRNAKLLEIIHTNICRPFDVLSFRDEKYSITFIDDYSHYCYVYLLMKVSILDTLQVFKIKVEKH